MSDKGTQLDRLEALVGRLEVALGRLERIESQGDQPPLSPEALLEAEKAQKAADEYIERRKFELLEEAGVMEPFDA